MTKLIIGSDLIIIKWLNRDEDNNITTATISTFKFILDTYYQSRTTLITRENKDISAGAINYLIFQMRFADRYE